MLRVLCEDYDYMPYTDEEEIRADCDLLVQLRPLHLTDFTAHDLELENEDTVVNILQKLDAVISYKHVLTITTEAIKYICRHPILPIIIIQLTNMTCNDLEFALAIEILYQLTAMNNAVSELDRQLIRWHFVDATNYKTLVDALYQINSTHKNVAVLDLKLKVLKILYSVSIQQGSQTQTSLVSTQNINCLKEFLSTYKTNGEVNTYLLGIIKIFCRNKQYCPLFCCDNFLKLFLATVEFTKKFALSATILTFLSKHGDSVQIMAKSEPLLNLIINTLVWEQTTNKKHVISTLYRITISKYYIKSSHYVSVELYQCGCGETVNNTFAPNARFDHREYISQLCYWNKLLDYFQQFEKQRDDQKSNLLAVKVYTILNRGITSKNIEIPPPSIDVQMPENVATLQKVPCWDNDSDNEEDDEKENSGDSDSEKELDRNECDDYHKDFPKTRPIINEMRTNSASLFAELTSDSASSARSNIQIFADDIDHRNKIISQRTRMNPKINYRAFPDCVVDEAHDNHIDFVTSRSNGFEIQTLANKVKAIKDNITGTRSYRNREVYNLDKLIDSEATKCPDIPNPTHYSIEGTRQEKARRDYLQFESRFESGNLRQAEQVGEFEYNLLLSPDVHLTNGLQWFYFQLSNMIAGQQYTLNIINFVKVNSQFNYGLQPVFFSVLDYIINCIGWRKRGEKIIYHGNEFVDEHTQKQLRTLSFSIRFPYSDDYCYIAYHYPYTYSKLMMKSAALLTANKSLIYSRCDKLCATVNNKNDVPLITITSSEEREESGAVSFHKRPIVFLTARVHPCESNASWIMDGVLNFLLNEQDERAIQARDRFIFKIIPMLNVEGVIYGNSRCGLTGHDLNRCWKRPNQVLHPEIFYTKELVRYAKDVLKKPIVTFIDIHGHSRKKFFFFYGCNPELSWNDKGRESTRSNFNSLPKAVAATNDSMKLSFCRFNIEKKKESTCRIVMWREFGIDLSYTLECSYCSGANKKKITVPMLQNIGKSIVIALLDLQEGDH